MSVYRNLQSKLYRIAKQYIASNACFLRRFWSLLYYLTRICFLLIALGLFLVVRKRLTPKIQKIYFATAIFIVIISFLFPVDNYFVSFSTPESSYRYNHIGSATVVAEGNQSSFLVESHNEKKDYVIIPKSNGKWKTDLGFATQLINHKSENSIVISVYKCKGTADYYVTVLNTEGGSVVVSDTCNSNFAYLNYKNEQLNKEFYTYYAYIDSFDVDSYTLYVDDTAIKF